MVPQVDQDFMYIYMDIMYVYAYVYIYSQRNARFMATK